jgi:hypothetical protein
MGVDEFSEIHNKMLKRLDSWNGTKITLGRRLTLNKTWLRSMPMHTMGFYLLAVHNKMSYQATILLARCIR